MSDKKQSGDIDRRSRVQKKWDKIGDQGASRKPVTVGPRGHRRSRFPTGRR